jgi:hypothetical protein
MTDRFLVSRRTLLAGLGGAILAPLVPVAAVGQTRPALALQARVGTVVLRPGAETPIWLLQAATGDSALRFKRGDEIDVTLQNQLPVSIALNWHGIDGAPAAEPLLGRPPLAAGGTDTFRLPLRHAGTFMADLRLLGDAYARPSTARALVVLETTKSCSSRRPGCAPTTPPQRPGATRRTPPLSSPSTASSASNPPSGSMNGSDFELSMAASILQLL